MIAIFNIYFVWTSNSITFNYFVIIGDTKLIIMITIVIIIEVTAKHCFIIFINFYLIIMFEVDNQNYGFVKKYLPYSHLKFNSVLIFQFKLIMLKDFDYPKCNKLDLKLITVTIIIKISYFIVEFA